MTKDEFIMAMKYEDDAPSRMFSIKMFFESNACIPKGKNRRDDADIWHEFAEDKTKIVQYFDGVNWRDGSLNNHGYRIKTSEPVYEYQWILNSSVSDLKFYTAFEASQWSCITVKRIEETKRERK